MAPKINIKNSSKRQRHFFAYRDEDLQNAIKAVKEEGMSKKLAARQFCIPRSTLIRKLSGTVPLRRKMGPSTLLTEPEEDTLVKWILAMARKGFPVHKSNLILSVKKYLQETGRETKYLKDSTPGRSWFEGFLKRHPNIKEKHAESVSKARAAVTQDRIQQWFDEILEYFQQEGLENILEYPHRIFNGNEAGFKLSPKSGKVLGPTKVSEDFYERVSCDKEQITVMATFSADGKVVPPMLIFPFKKMPKIIVESVPENWGLGRSDSGWINSEVFYEYISNHFLPYLNSEKITRPVILFVDGHRSHLTQQVSRFCDEHGIILISLFPNTTHIMQPADVAVFKPLKSGWTSAVRTWKFQNFPKEVTRYTFGPILKYVFDQYATAKTIQNGFRKSGLYPFDKNNVDYSKCITNRKVSDDLNNNEHNKNQLPNIVLGTVEKKIDKQDLQQFLQTYESQVEWKGSIESTNLYKVWCSLKNDCKITFQQDSGQNIVTPNFQIDHLQDNSIQQMLDGHEETSSLSAWMTPENVSIHCYDHKKNEDYKVPSPFKKCLVFPKTPEKNITKRKRAIFPAVVSSGKYREYYDNEMKKKSALKDKKKKIDTPPNHSSESEIDVHFNEDLNTNE